MKTITDDPEGFFESGGWTFLDQMVKEVEVEATRIRMMRETTLTNPPIQMTRRKSLRGQKNFRKCQKIKVMMMVIF
jgi:hypothetical protein